MIIIAILALPFALLISGIILGWPRETLAERYLFWMSCVGLALLLVGGGVAAIGSINESKIYCDNLAMGPVTTVGNIFGAIGVILSVLGLFVQVGIGISRLVPLIRSLLGKK
jgi:hypothetical protein